jgi:hypothetical protein
MIVTVTRSLILILIFTTGFLGCSDSSTDKSIPEPKSEHPGFTANVDGAVHAEISGDGIVTYLPPKEQDPMSGDRPGYFLIASLNTETKGDGGLNLTFRIPDGALPGNYILMTPDPLKVGETFDVRVETIEGGKPISYQSNTEGTIVLDNFYPDRASPRMSRIKGTFQFVTENIEGSRISANGTFDFPSETKVIS